MDAPDTDPQFTRPKFLGSIGAEQALDIGGKGFMESRSPSETFAVVFEDDGDTGYFYALDMDLKPRPIVDAVCIYTVNNSEDLDSPSKFTIVWSLDGMKAALFVNDHPHAVFDFSARRGYCRTNFPEPGDGWDFYSHEWHDSALDLFQ